MLWNHFELRTAQGMERLTAYLCGRQILLLLSATGVASLQHSTDKEVTASSKKMQQIKDMQEKVMSSFPAIRALVATLVSWAHCGQRSLTVCLRVVY